MPNLKSGANLLQNNQMYKYLDKKNKYARIILLFWINRCQLQATATVNSAGTRFCGRAEFTAFFCLSTFDYCLSTKNRTIFLAHMKIFS